MTLRQERNDRSRTLFHFLLIFVALVSVIDLLKLTQFCKLIDVNKQNERKLHPNRRNEQQMSIHDHKKKIVENGRKKGTCFVYIESKMCMPKRGLMKYIFLLSKLKTPSVTRHHGMFFEFCFV